MKFHLVGTYCPNCGKSYICFRPEENRLEDSCHHCNKTFTIESKPIPNGQALYIFEKPKEEDANG